MAKKATQPAYTWQQSTRNFIFRNVCTFSLCLPATQLTTTLRHLYPQLYPTKKSLHRKKKPLCNKRHQHTIAHPNKTKYDIFETHGNVFISLHTILATDYYLLLFFPFAFEFHNFFPFFYSWIVTVFLVVFIYLFLHLNS